MINFNASTLMMPKQTIFLEDGLAYLSKLPATKLLVIASKRSLKNYKYLEKLLDNKKRFQTKVLHPKWQNEPSFDGILLTAGEIQNFSPDWIVAIGGGSIIDGSKIAWAMY